MMFKISLIFRNDFLLKIKSSLHSRVHAGIITPPCKTVKPTMVINDMLKIIQLHHATLKERKPIRKEVPAWGLRPYAPLKNQLRSITTEFPNPFQQGYGEEQCEDL
jgi:hypothetical protein